MNNYFEYKLTHNQIFFTYTNKSEIDEREIHTYNEILFYLGDDIPFLTETFSTQVTKKSLIYIPKEKYHYFDNSNTNIPRLKIAFYDNEAFANVLTKLNDIKIINQFNETIHFALNKICSVLENCDSESEKLSAVGAFCILLTEIGKIENSITKTISRTISESIDFIADNLQNEINICQLSQKLGISQSALTHNFKKEIGISVHKYIQQKRLILAKSLIEEGNKPTKIYFDCGYSDYSSFYKAYLKMFGYPPSILEKR